jgi:hypothetical protein
MKVTIQFEDDLDRWDRDRALDLAVDEARVMLDHGLIRAEKDVPDPDRRRNIAHVIVERGEL